MPAIMDRLSKNPLKFILFIDDLSFAKDDDDFAALKAILRALFQPRLPMWLFMLLATEDI